MKTGAWILLFFIVSIASAVGQEVSFSQLTSEDGISQSEVYCFLHDSKGFMWFGILDGLNRYDGYTIETIKMSKDDLNSLNHNTVYLIVEDKFSSVWLILEEWCTKLSYHLPGKEVVSNIVGW